MHPKIDISKTVVAVENVFTSAVGDELIIFDHVQGTYFGSGVVGRVIWSMISEKRSIKVICDEVFEQFEVDRNTCEIQVVQFLKDLEEKELVRVV